MVSSPRALAGRKRPSSHSGGTKYLSIIGVVSCHLHNPIRLSSVTSLKALGDLEKFQSDVAFLLVLIEREQQGIEYMAFPQCG